MTSLLKTCGGASHPTSLSKFVFIPGACGPQTPAIYPSNPQTHFYRLSNCVSVAKHHFHTWNLNCADLKRAQVECAGTYVGFLILINYKFLQSIYSEVNFIPKNIKKLKCCFNYSIKIRTSIIQYKSYDGRIRLT